MCADYVHIVDSVTPIEKTMEALVELQKFVTQVTRVIIRSVTS